MWCLSNRFTNVAPPFRAACRAKARRYEATHLRGIVKALERHNTSAYGPVLLSITGMGGMEGWLEVLSWVTHKTKPPRLAFGAGRGGKRQGNSDLLRLEV